MVTHCRQGHPYDAANTYVTPAGDRHCRACRRDHDHQRFNWKGGQGRLGLGPQSQRTHCPHGHAYDAANTYVTSAGRRICRACKTSASKARAMFAAMARAEGRE